MAKNKGGRPLEISIERRMELVKLLEKYVEETEMPIIAEFAYKNNIGRDYLYDNSEFSALLKKCIAKKEVYLERESLKGTVNTTQAIFSLKQIGWKDKIEQTNINPAISINLKGV